MNEASWTRILDAAAVTVERPRAVKRDGKQIVVFRDGDDLHAIDNRCPHEGYPLITGALKDGVLTCEWHNWKFRLCDGVCVLGGEDVRRYPLRVQDDGIWLDLQDRPGDDERPRQYRSLEAAFDDSDWSRAGRSIERLLAAGEPPAAILARGCLWGAAHAPYGFDHGLAAAADWAAMLDAFGGDVGIPLLEALNLMVFPNVRRPVRPTGAAVDLGDARSAIEAGEWAAVGAALRAAIEAEELERAEALTTAAIEAGAGPAQVFDWLTRAVTDHFLGYGHSQIYTAKAEELLEAIGWDHAAPIAVSLVASIVYETREDRLPYMREYKRAVAPYTARLDEWAAAFADTGKDNADADTDADDAGAAGFDVDAFVTAVVDGSLAEALAAVADLLDRQIAPDRIAAALGMAAAHRLLRFDAELEHRDDIEEGWLHITHTLTHADAVRESLRRHPSADALRGLFHSARFIQHLAVCDAPAAQRSAIGDAAPAPDAPDRGLGAALERRDADAAMAAARAGLRDGADIAGALRQQAVSDRASLPIFVLHHVKTAMAALRLSSALAADPAARAHPAADLPMVATARFLAHPLAERRVARRAKISREFVRAGRLQTKLLGY